MSKQFNLTQCLTLVLIAALVLGLLAKHVRHKSEVAALRTAMEESRSTFRTIEYGAANLQLLGLNPAVWEDRDCSLFLKRELAFSVLEHWREKDAIDFAYGRSGYALEFAGHALTFLECKSVDDLVTIATGELSIYPDDELAVYVCELSDADFLALDVFIKAATLLEPSDGG